MDHPSAAAEPAWIAADWKPLPRPCALSRHGYHTRDTVPLGNDASPLLVPLRTSGRGSLPMPGRQHAAGRNDVLAPTCTHPTERVHSSATLASALGFRPHRRARSGARIPYRAKLAGDPVL